MQTNHLLAPEYDVVIVGAGASGLMCAITAANRGRKVLVIEHANKLGKKILISGGGRCNYTNLDVKPDNFLSQNQHFCKSALARYSQWDFQRLVEKHHIPWHEKTKGQLFCDNRSQDIVDMLVKECSELEVTILLKTAIFEAIKPKNYFVITTSRGKTHCQSLVVATGGLSFPSMGATGYGYQLAEQFGHSLVKQRAGLVPFILPQKWLDHFSELSGVSANVIISSNNVSFQDFVLFTHKGLSGPAVLQVSSFWKPGSVVSINWLPDESAQQWCETAKMARPKAMLSTVLAEVLTRRLAHLLCHYGRLKELSKRGEAVLQQIPSAQLIEIATCLQSWDFVPSGTEGYKKAEVTIGGLSTDDISSKTFESNLLPRLFFIGEVLDVTGHLGGFNFQWAWASGYCAGSHC